MKRLVLLVGVLLMMGSVFAGISISEPLDVYNLGDRIYIDLTGLKGEDNGNLDINLDCGNGSINLVRIPARAFSSGEEQAYSVPYKILNWEDLGIVNLKSIVGACQLVVMLGTEVVSSNSFEVRDDINVVASLDKLEYNPGEPVRLKIEAVKANGVMLNGFIEGYNATFFNRVIGEGFAEEVFTIGETAEAGAYFLNIRAYDSGSNGVLNEGEKTVSYFVNQIVTSLVLSLSGTNVVPGEDFSIGIGVFDQSGVEMEGTASVKLISPSGEEREMIIQAGDFASIDFLGNSSVGIWKVSAQFNNLIQEREFEIMSLQKIEFDFEESVLAIRNVGNTLYNKTIDVKIGEDVKILDLKIAVGEIRKFSLEAPVGNYDVVVGDGDSEVSQRVLLTGNAISVNDLKSGIIFADYSFVWIFLIVILGGIGTVLFMRYRKTRTVGDKSNVLKKWMGKIRKHGKSGMKIKDKIPNSIKSRMDESLNFTKKSPAVQGLDFENYSHEDKSMVDFTKKSMAGAEASLVLKGEKHMSVVVAISVKNYEEDSDGIAKQSLMEIIEKFKGKGLIDYRNEYIFIVFSPVATRTYKNEILAVKSGMQILENLNAYNKKFRDKIEFGIGIHAGEMVASKAGGKFKYTGIGNTISFAKRMSDVDSGKVVVSDVVKKKLLRELKVVKGKEIGEKETYVVNEIMDRSGDAEKLKQLMARQSE